MDAQNNIELLDCTFRDGGYHNQWNFPGEVVQEQINILSANGINYCEMGYRKHALNMHGEQYSTTEDYLSAFTKPKGFKFVVMSDARDIIKLSTSSDLGLLFKEPADRSQIDLLRIAVHYDGLLELQSSISQLIGVGYRIALNLMQISDRSDEEILAFIKYCMDHNVRIAYFADSFGALNIKRTSEISNIFRESYHGWFGVHMHDNMGMALQNSLVAVEKGAKFIDCSITGMGRGAGNTILEECLVSLRAGQVALPRDLDLACLIEKYYAPLKSKNSWGKNQLYFIAGIHSIHPTYVQLLQQNGQYGYQKLVQIVGALSKKPERHSFDQNLFDELIQDVANPQILGG